MIQRIQSVYMLLTTIVSGLFLRDGFLSIVNDEGTETFLKFNGIYQKVGETGFNLIDKMIPLTVLTLLIPLISFITIFLFKKRDIQLKITRILLLLEILLIATGAWYTITMVQISPSSIVPRMNFFIPFIEIILTFLAYLGIRKDQVLIKSYDRLR